MKDNPEQGKLIVADKSDHSVMWTCMEMLTFDEKILKDRITDYLVRQDVGAFFESCMCHNSRLFTTALRLRERELGPLPETDISDDEDEQEETKKPKIDFSHPMIGDWLRTKPEAKFMLLKGALAEEILDSISKELGIDRARRVLDDCADQETSKKMFLSAIDKCLERIEDMLVAYFDESLKEIFYIARSRSSQQSLLQ